MSPKLCTVFSIQLWKDHWLEVNGKKHFWVMFPEVNRDHNDQLSVKWGYSLLTLKRLWGGWQGKQCIRTEAALNTGTERGMQEPGF